MHQAWAGNPPADMLRISWGKNPHKQDYYARYGILLDMVGGPNAVFKHDAVSNHFAPSILKKIWKIANNLGYGQFFQYQLTPHIIDDHYYINNLAHIPTIDIIEHDNQTVSCLLYTSPSPRDRA